MALNLDEKRIRLKSIADENWEDTVKQRIAKLPTARQELAKYLVNVLPHNGETHEQRQTRTIKLQMAFTDLTGKQRLQVLTALHPELGADIDRRWNHAIDSPYQRGWMRRAFRAPQDPALTEGSRFSNLCATIRAVAPYRRDIAWLAAWGDLLRLPDLAGLLAAAIDHNPEHGDAVFEALMQTVRGEHAIAVMHNAAIGGLLRASRPDGWELVQGALLGAQRQEGLRQAILEQIDEGHPEAFPKMVRVMLENDLLRFAAGVRAIGVWVGLPFDVEHKADAVKLAEGLLEVISDKDGFRAAVTSDDPMRVYSALVARGLVDAVAATAEAQALLTKVSAPCRVAVAWFLGAVHLTQSQAVLLEMLEDQHLDVAASAFTKLTGLPSARRYANPAQTDDLSAMDLLLRLIDRLPATVRVPAVLFGTEPHEVSRNEVLNTAMQHHHGDMDLFLKYFDSFDAYNRTRFAYLCARKDSVSNEVRTALLTTVGSRGSCSEVAVQTLSKLTLQPEDASKLEPLLKRKATKLRSGVVSLLMSLPDEPRTACATRLWGGTTEQRNAACELIADVESEEAATYRRAWAEDANDRQRELLGESDDAEDIAEPFDPEGRTPAVQPSGIKKPKPLVTTAAAKLLSGLDDLAERYKDTEVTISNWQGSVTILLADVSWAPPPLSSQELEEGVERDMLLGDVVRRWWDKRPSNMFEKDGTEAARALLIHWFDIPDESGLVPYNAATLRHPRVVAHWLTWFGQDVMTADLLGAYVTASEYQAQNITAAELDTLPRQSESRSGRGNQDPRHRVTLTRWYREMEQTVSSRPDLVTDDLIARLWRLERWIEEPVPDAYPHKHSMRWVRDAFERGLATEDDMRHNFSSPYGDLAPLTRRRRDNETSPLTLAVADRFRDDLVANELARGDIALPTSRVVRRLSSIEGADLAMLLVSRLGTVNWSRGYSWGDDKKATLSHLIGISYPAADDDASSLHAAATAHSVKDKQLVEFGVYAPQWAAIVERVLKWEGFENAVWWIHAHTKDNGWSIAAELRETWAALSAERTPLSSTDLLEGAVDLDWFWRVHKTLGSKRWSQVYSAGKYASSGAGHRRAQLFADVITGSVAEKEIIGRIVGKRHQDSVRGLGLLPLPKAATTKQKSLLKRYHVLREFERGIRKHGSQRQASERTALRIGLENLARNAGYRDPARFSWAMEADELDDLADGPITIEVDGVTITLGIDERGIADLAVSRGSRALKQVPAKLRKLDPVLDLRERKTKLTKQVSRVRKSLETAMVEADSFTVAGLAELRRHPVVAPMLRTLVFVDRAGKCLRLDGDEFRSLAGRKVKPSTKGDGEVRIAHPVDLLDSKKWSEWQSWCFVEGIQQPFKQVFRELYVPTKAELTGLPESERYSGHQVQPSQTKALFTARAWHTHHDDYSVSKTFHHEGLVARVELDGGFFSPADVELPVLHSLWFTKRSEGTAQPISAVPGIMFSEVMRDLDLVVSVAHAGGVDPEASASTVEMRQALVRETVAILGLDNVREVGHHVVIEGKLGEYSLHLGSGTVHRRPGGQVCIVPVHAQRRGRLFLPFADDDPRTAEVLSKLLLFARDDQIQDPTILSQLRA